MYLASNVARTSLLKSSKIGLLLSSKNLTVSAEFHFQSPRDNKPSTLKLC